MKLATRIRPPMAFRAVSSGVERIVRNRAEFYEPVGRLQVRIDLQRLCQAQPFTIDLDRIRRDGLQLSRDRDACQVGERLAQGPHQRGSHHHRRAAPQLLLAFSKTAPGPPRAWRPRNSTRAAEG